jgi:hypothetical protein
LVVALAVVVAAVVVVAHIYRDVRYIHVSVAVEVARILSASVVEEREAPGIRCGMVFRTFC